MNDNQWHRVAALNELPEKDPVAVKVDGKDVLLVRIGNEVYATRAKCTHYGAPLKNGLLNGCEITCPWHNARFDITNGKMQNPPALDDLRSFQTKVENGDVFVGAPIPVQSAALSTDSTLNDKTFVIIGAGAAGNAAAETLRREGFSGRIMLVTSENRLPYDRPNLSKDFLSGEADPDWMPLRSKEFYEKKNIEVLTERKVQRLKPEEHEVYFSNGDAIKYDRVLLATGGKPRSLSVPGGDLPNVFLLRSMADAEAILKAAETARRTAILGSGFIGLEAAAALRQRELEVVLATQEEVPMKRVFGERIGKWIRQMHESQGVEFRFGVTPDRVEQTESGLRLCLSDGSTVETDLVIVGFGVDPSVDYLKDSGLLHNGAVTVNERLQTKSEDIFAAGDIAVFPDPHTGAEWRIEHWAVAEAQGKHAARAMLGSKAPYDEVPFFWTRQFGKSVKYIGHATSYDRVVVRGEFEEERFFVGYFLDGRLMAASSLNGGREFLALGLLIKSGKLPSIEFFEDPGNSFVEALAKS
ncbi:MAG: FAD-dependent oxidoreductase [Acidobacteriota bacterium]